MRVQYETKQFSAGYNYTNYILLNNICLSLSMPRLPQIFWIVLDTSRTRADTEAETRFLVFKLLLLLC